MRRAWVAVLLLAGCIPGLTPGRLGFVAARAPGYGSIGIEPNPSFFGEPADAVAGWWNVAAGRELFKINAAPAIAFRAGGPFITPTGRRVVAYASQRRNPDGSMHSCTVYYDPSFVAAGWPGRHLSTYVFAHEVGHCLELDAGADNDPQFWQKAIAGWGPTSTDTAQLRAARYIP